MTDQNRRFALAAGLCWHELMENVAFRFNPNAPHAICSCGKPLTQADHKNPDFTDAREVLRVMLSRDDREWFVGMITDKSWNFGTYLIEGFSFLVTDTTGRLRDLAIQYLEGR